MFDRFLFGTQPTTSHQFPTTRPNAEQMYTRAMTHPAPTGIINLATANWKQAKKKTSSTSSPFYGHSYTAPTPKEHILQQIGLVISDAIALHIRDVKLGNMTEPSDPYDEDFDHITPTTTAPHTRVDFDNAEAILQGHESGLATHHHQPPHLRLHNGPLATTNQCQPPPTTLNPLDATIAAAQFNFNGPLAQSLFAPTTPITPAAVTPSRVTLPLR